MSIYQNLKYCEVSIYCCASSVSRVKLKGMCLTKQPVTALNTISESVNMHQSVYSHLARTFILNRNRSWENPKIKKNWKEVGFPVYYLKCDLHNWQIKGEFTSIWRERNRSSAATVPAPYGTICNMVLSCPCSAPFVELDTNQFLQLRTEDGIISIPAPCKTWM